MRRMLLNYTGTAILSAVFFVAVQGRTYNSTSPAPGRAIVSNECDHNVYLHNVPASGGGHSEIDRVLSPGDRYEQHFTPLSNGQGWSIKMCKDAILTDHNILQYEYTWHPMQSPATVWFDLSQVNGSPWQGNYHISATGADCHPKQHAYRFPTDDAFGMQSCPSNANIIVTLCSLSGTGRSKAAVEAANPRPSYSVEHVTEEVSSATASRKDTVLSKKPSIPASTDVIQEFHVPTTFIRVAPVKFYDIYSGGRILDAADALTSRSSKSSSIMHAPQRTTEGASVTVELAVNGVFTFVLF